LGWAERSRLLAQFGFFFAQNPFLNNFVTGEIHQGASKRLCTPGLNCYSCPAAVFSCPIGAAQIFFGGARHNISFYVTGFLLTVGVLFGRFICGFVCPMGLLQDLLYRIRSPKLKLRLRFLRYIKYFVLLLFVIVLPMVVVNEFTGSGLPWFCAYICPSGTIFGAIPLLGANPFLRGMIGAQFFIKAGIAAVVVISSVFVLRVFCRVLCPLGAIYGLLNKVAIVHMRCDKAKCIRCGKCSDACHSLLSPATQPNAVECFRCGKCVSACGQKALAVRAAPHLNGGNYMQITHIGHSGFLVETQGINLIFDYYTDKAGIITPKVFKGKKTYVFVSHTHGDHYNKAVFEWAKHWDVAYVLDADCDTPDIKNIFKLNEGDSLDLPGQIVSVRAFGSTDEGLSFLVRIPETTLFHAGDLNSWYWEDEKTPEELEASEGEYLRIIKQLPVGEIDIAFVPEDPRLGKHAGRAIMHFKDIVKPGRIIPMHFPGNDGVRC